MIGQPHDEILNGRLDSFPTEELGQKACCTAPKRTISRWHM